MAHRSLLLILLAPCGTALLAPPARTCTVLNAQVGSSSRSRAFTKTGPRKPQSPRPEQYPNEQKLEDLAVKKRNIKYDPEYADDIARAMAAVQAADSHEDLDEAAAGAIAALDADAPKPDPATLDIGLLLGCKRLVAGVKPVKPSHPPIGACLDGAMR